MDNLKKIEDQDPLIVGKMTFFNGQIKDKAIIFEKTSEENKLIYHHNSRARKKQKKLESINNFTVILKDLTTPFLKTPLSKEEKEIVSEYQKKHPEIEERIKKNFLMYCDSCKSTGDFEVYEKKEDQSSLQRCVYEKYVCSSCKKEYDFFSALFLGKKGRHDSSSYVVNCMKVFNDKEEGKVRLSFIYKKVTAFNNRLQFKEDKIKITFDFKTGQTYFIAPKSKDFDVYPTNRDFINITFGMKSSFLFHFCTEQDLMNIAQELKAAIEDNLKDNLKYSPYKFDITKSKMLNFSELLNLLSLYNRFPYADPFIISKISSFLPHESVRKGMTKLSRKLKRNNQESINTLLKHLKIRNVKSIRKTFLNHPATFHLLKDNVFENIDLAVSLAKNINSYGLYFDFVLSSCEYMSKFVEYFKHEKGELWCVKKINQYIEQATIDSKNDGRPIFQGRDFRLFRDTVRMHRRIKLCKGNATTKLKGDIRTIHDSLTEEHLLIKETPIPIYYTEKELKLVSTIDDVDFILPEDTSKIKLTGKSMNICVGSYSDRVVDKEILIVVMKRDGEDVGCLEIKNREVVQAKAKFNNIIEGEDKIALLKWIEENNLSINTYDISITEEEIACLNAQIAV